MPVEKFCITTLILTEYEPAVFQTLLTNVGFDGFEVYTPVLFKSHKTWAPGGMFTARKL
jgi:hypothetical protein